MPVPIPIPLLQDHNTLLEQTLEKLNAVKLFGLAKSLKERLERVLNHAHDIRRKVHEALEQTPPRVRLSDR